MAKYRDENDFDEEVSPREMIDNMHLIRLGDCAQSTRMGMIDCGFPRYMAKLAAVGFVTEKGNGYVCTSEGFAYLESQKKRFQKL